MRKLTVPALALAALIATAAPHASALPAAPLEVGARVFVGGGTPLTNGLFFPGTGLNDGSKIQWAPAVQVPQGTDFELVNLDESLVSNAHKLVSFKRRGGRPLFSSDTVSQPGQTSLVTTSNLKPGTYMFFCSFHSGMLGRIQITQP
jgi:hypothetical protein